MEVAACGFRRGALEELFSGNGGAQPMELYAHLQQGLPLILDAQETSLPHEAEERLAAPCALESIALHGIVDLSGEFASYICMRKTRQRFSDADYTVLRLIAPYMNSAILQVRRSLFAQEYAPLRRPMVQPTQRELEILGLLYVGKTNKEIGRALGISAMTVKNHTKNIYAKLTARKMMKMLDGINGDYLKGIGDPARQPKVTCYTCHRGQKTPATAAAAPPIRYNIVRSL